MTNLTNEQQQIMDYVSKFGCIDIKQLNIIMRPLNPDLIAVLVNMLIKANRLEIMNDHIIVIKGEKQKYNRDMINCIWVMIKLTNCEGYQSVLNGNSPAKLYFTASNSRAYEVIPLNESTLINIRAVQDRYLAKSKQFKEIFNSYIVFVCEGKEIVKKIKECHLKFAFIVAYIDKGNNITDIPMIKFLKSEPKEIPE